MGPRADLDAALVVLGRALAGDGPAADLTSGIGGPPGAVPEGTAAVVATSGSTGRPRRVALGARGLRHSARATHAVLGGPGQWVLAMPADRVGGLQVLVRSLEAGTAPVRVDDREGFTAAAFAAAVGSARDRAGAAGLVHTALVPTQLVRLLADDAGRDALAAVDSVLVGGAALSPATADRAERAGARLVTTYGMTETSGGCVYDGRPLPGVEVAVEETTGVVRLGGEVVALGYLADPGRTSAAFSVDPGGQRWFVTSDVGDWHDGLLTVTGRLDDIINTGGLKVAPAQVEAALQALPWVGEAVVVGVPDPEWGQRVAALLVPPVGGASPAAGTIDQPDVTHVRDALRDRLPAHALPRQVVWAAADGLATLPSGKPDRAAARSALAAGGGRMADHS